MPSGSKIRLPRNCRTACPEATSTTRDERIDAGQPAYRQREPGWKSSGAAASRGTEGPGLLRLAGKELFPRKIARAGSAAEPGPRCASSDPDRDLALGRDELDFRRSVPLTATFMPLNSGMNFETGS